MSNIIRHYYTANIESGNNLTAANSNLTYADLKKLGINNLYSIIHAYQRHTCLKNKTIRIISRNALFI